MGKRSSSQLQWFVGSLLLPAFFAGCGGGGSTPASVSVSLTPSNASVFVGKTQQFTATVKGASNTSCSWKVQEGAAGGTITQQGLYNAPGVPDTYHVVATSQADASKSATATVVVQEEDGGVEVSGRVLDATSDSDTGVPGAEVSIRSPRSRQSGEKKDVTDAQGYYAIENVQPGTATLSVTLPDGTYRALELEIEVPTDRPTASATVRLVPRDVAAPTAVEILPKNASVPEGETWQFRAQVVPEGVKAFFSMRGTVGTIDENGNFEALKVGSGIVVAHAGNLKAETTVTVTATTGTITGTVKDSTGAPVGSAYVKVVASDMVVETSAAGVYRFDRVPKGDRLVSAQKEGYLDTSHRVTVPAGGSVTLDLTLQPEPKCFGEVEGAVLDATTGAALPFAGVGIVDGPSTQTLTPGGFELKKVPCGTQTLVVTKQGYASATRSLEIKDRDDRVNVGPIYLVPLASVPNKPPL